MVSCPASSHPCSSNTCMHIPPHHAQLVCSMGRWWMASATRDAAVHFTQDRTGLSSFFLSLSLSHSLTHSLSLSHFNSVCVSLSLPSSSHLPISPRLVASSPPAGVKDVKKRSERRLVLFDRRAVSRVEAAWTNAAAEVGGGIRRRDSHPSTCWIMSFSHGAFTSMWERLQTGKLAYFRMIVVSIVVKLL